MRAPRVLWVPFELGRPFGSPGEPAFQRRVVSDALALLNSKKGPVVLADFPDDAPGPKTDDQTGWVCPVSFPAPLKGDAKPVEQLLQEIDALAPWYQLSKVRRGRTLVGVSGKSVPDAVCFVASFHDEIPLDNSGRAMSQEFKDAITDIMAYYSEAGTAQPGQHSSGDTQRWFGVRRQLANSSSISARNLWSVMTNDFSSLLRGSCCQRRREADQRGSRYLQVD